MKTADHQSASRALLNLTVAGADLALLDALEQLRLREDWPAPAKDAAVYGYLAQLRDLPPGSVDVAVMDYLKAYPVNTLVANQDHGQGLEPLFQVRAAAAGLEHSWQRQEAILEGRMLLHLNPASLADAYMLESSAPVRSGYRAALAQASTAQVEALLNSTLPLLASDAALTPLLAEAAQKNGDVDALLLVLQDGSGAAIAPMLRALRDNMGADQQRKLLLAVLPQDKREKGKHRPDQHQNAALALAELAPGLVGDARIDKALLGLLDHADLGAAAALALARSPNPNTMDALSELAAGDQQAMAARARMALALQDELSLERSP
jgi:hypothetical protein